MTNTQSKISKNATQIVDAQSSSVEPELAQLSSRAPLPITDVAEEALKECIICYESLNTTKNICITECGHEFCFSCMMKHVQRNNGCPMCRSAIIEEVDTDEFSEGEYDEDDDATIEEEVEELFEACLGKCQICQIALVRPTFNSPKEMTTMHIDHNHITGKARGILCHHCNVGLGSFKDKKDLLEQAIRYLDEA